MEGVALLPRGLRGGRSWVGGCVPRRAGARAGGRGGRTIGAYRVHPGAGENPAIERGRRSERTHRPGHGPLLNHFVDPRADLSIAPPKRSLRSDQRSVLPSWSDRASALMRSPTPSRRVTEADQAPSQAPEGRDVDAFQACAARPETDQDRRGGIMTNSPTGSDAATQLEVARRAAEAGPSPVSP